MLRTARSNRLGNTVRITVRIFHKTWLIISRAVLGEEVASVEEIKVVNLKSGGIVQRLL